MALTTSPLAPGMLWLLLDADISYFGKALAQYIYPIDSLASLYYDGVVASSFLARS
jgi:hypothetical protein